MDTGDATASRIGREGVACEARTAWIGVAFEPRGVMKVGWVLKGRAPRRLFVSAEGLIPKTMSGEMSGARGGGAG
jgi:hypothetical protein